MAEGILGRKIGMTQIFDPRGNAVPVTVIQAGPCLVTRKRTTERDGYTAVQLAFEQVREKLVNKAQQGEFAKLGQAPLRHLKEFRVTAEQLARYTEGAQVKADLFKAGEKVDVVGVSKGKGFSGVMKRHNFSGFHDSHGVHEYFRHGGSIGTNMTPGRTVKGRKMPGQQGNRQVTVQSLTVVRVDLARNLILIEGAVPGGKNGLVMIKKGAKKGAKD
ncbi:MAG: 50S ribosomal protein L3 [Myxococcota bacterium]|jgi:large subunit ribosomal protein L3|nr:50S ribosomal protein L3 [Myxococcota bacterium]